MIAAISFVLVTVPARFVLAARAVRGEPPVVFTVFVACNTAIRALLFRTATAFVRGAINGAKSISSWRTSNLTVSACGGAGVNER